MNSKVCGKVWRCLVLRGSPPFVFSQPLNLLDPQHESKAPNQGSVQSYYLNFARNIDFKAIGSFFSFCRLSIQFQDSVQEISCLRKVQGESAGPKRPLRPWSCPGTCSIQRFEKALHGRRPGIVNGIFDLFTVAVGDHLGGNE